MQLFFIEVDSDQHGTGRDEWFLGQFKQNRLARRFVFIRTLELEPLVRSFGQTRDAFDPQHFSGERFQPEV